MTTPICYAQNYEDARLMWSALRSSGIPSKVKAIKYGCWPFSLEVALEIADRAADLAHHYAVALELATRGKA